MKGRGYDPAPLSAIQFWTLTQAVGRELSWGLTRGGHEVRRWRRLAEGIPDQPIRSQALRSLERKSGNIIGAGLFTILTQRRNADLLSALIAVQVTLDVLDNLNETHPTKTNGLRLHLALTDAVRGEGPLDDYYAEHPWSDDGGYLNAILEHCKEKCAVLPSYQRVRPFLIRESTHTGHVLALNHIPAPAQRDAELRSWAEAEFPRETDLSWFERCAAASGQLGTYALLALAAEPDVTDREIVETQEAYWPLVPTLAVMLDSLADEAEDTRSGHHVYVGHYASREQAVTRLSELIPRAIDEVLTLRNGHRHAVVVSAMIGYYLSKATMRAASARPDAERLIRSGGSLTRLLAPVARTWRLTSRQNPN